MLPYQMRAIVWAQWRSFRNKSPFARRSFPLAAIVMGLWYSLWILGAIGIGIVCAVPDQIKFMQTALGPLLLGITIYWQLMPVLLTSSGAALDLKRLLPYPIPKSQLFSIEMALRVTGAAEMLILVLGAAIGTLLNPALPFWRALPFLLFIIFNLLMSSAIRDVLTRLMGRKRIREVVVLVFVFISVLPQVIIHNAPDLPDSMPRQIRRISSIPWPWTATADLVAGRRIAICFAALLAWTALAWAIARWQFNAGLKENAAELRATDTKQDKRRGLAEALYRLPSQLFADPLGAMIDKEVRTLSRSPRFRLVFIMGFTFGLVIWLPMGYKEHNWVGEHFLTVAMAYEVLLLGDVVIWNIFGFDRKATQVWFALPVTLTKVFAAKNLTAVFFLVLDAVLIAVMTLAVGLRPHPAMFAEAIAVTAIFAVLLLAIGNMLSVRNPRPVDPDQSWARSSAGKAQMTLFLIYPVVLAPIALAFLARHAFDSELAFYGVLALDLVIAIIVYTIALESALNTAKEKREELMAVLGREAGVLST